MLNIIKHYKVWFTVSGIILALGIISLAVYGLRLGIDFTGGTRTQLQFRDTPDYAKISQVLNSQNVGNVIVQRVENSSVAFKTKPLEKIFKY